LSWWNYKEVAEKLQTDYHVFLPILDGHAGCDRQYTTIENNALVIYTPKVRHIWRCISVTVVPFPIFPSPRLFFMRLCYAMAENVFAYAITTSGNNCLRTF